MQAEGPEPLTRLCSPAPALPCRHGPPPAATTAVTHTQPLPWLRGQRAPTQKRGGSSGPSGRPQDAPSQSPVASRLPTGGGLGREALLAGPAMHPSYLRQPESLSEQC